MSDADERQGTISAIAREGAQRVFSQGGVAGVFALVLLGAVLWGGHALVLRLLEHFDRDEAAFREEVLAVQALERALDRIAADQAAMSDRFAAELGRCCPAVRR